MLSIDVPGAGAWRRIDSKEDAVLSLGIDAAPAADHAAPIAGSYVDVSSEELLAGILHSLEDSKAEDIAQIDLRGKTAIGDYMIVCSGRSSRQVASIAERLVDTLKQDYGRLAKVEGKETGDWVLVDTGDVIVHVFRPEVREFYQLEKMWQSASGGTSDRR
ncbi:ribosome silencing factor [Primorskyibacter sedentarius]|uniref:Ribosomal silencing factor RsfS n=1 Tax=Primorskyibacter sedentarius TaxID=745311 RepID=A0A4R3J564_9RHOB|nr:ribosome silencing factor [Primorskyibacter sedentarius]TCS60412.1 ribosome-associated protein [Primorskyibacter sedentarius]